MTTIPHRLIALLMNATLAASVTAASVEELLGPELTTADGQTVATSSLQGKTIGLYFSAAWCKPCVRFTSNLVAFRNAHTDEFEVVLVSLDRNAKALRDYMTRSGMPWLAVPFEAPSREELRRRFEVRGIPRLVVLDDRGQVLATNGVPSVRCAPSTALQHWQANAAPSPAPTEILDNLEEQAKELVEQGFQQLRAVNESAEDLLGKIREVGGNFGLLPNAAPSPEPSDP